MNRQPEDAIDLLATDDRKTKELCGSERDGRRCMRGKGHDHEHAAFGTEGMATWPAEPSAVVNASASVTR